MPHLQQPCKYVSTYMSILRLSDKLRKGYLQIQEHI